MTTNRDKIQKLSNLSSQINTERLLKFWIIRITVIVRRESVIKRLNSLSTLSQYSMLATALRRARTTPKGLLFYQVYEAQRL